MVAEAMREGVITNMFVKKFKKKCGVRGCKNVTDVFIISRRREMGNTVAMCRECMIDALKATDNYQEVVKAKSVPRALFPHPEKMVTISSVADIEPEPKEVIEDAVEDFPISVAEDTVTEPKVAETPKPITKPKTKANGKKKTNKKK